MGKNTDTNLEAVALWSQLEKQGETLDEIIISISIVGDWNNPITQRKIEKACIETRQLLKLIQESTK